jgi:hypothetical protein
VEEDGATVKVEEPEPPTIILGVNVAVAPAGTPLTVNATLPVKPSSGTILIVYAALPPADLETVCEPGVIDPVKSPVEE